jgi:NAD(P)-dependent dehydrogenase (short-subunit alcohol dehydrogenase family)
MADKGTVIIIGGTSEFGKRTAEHYVAEGRSIVLTSRDAGRAQAAAEAVGPSCRGIALDLAQPETIAGALAGITDVDRVVITSVLRDDNNVKTYNVQGAMHLVTMKLVGYTEAIHALVPVMRDDASIVLYGGLAKDRPYPGSLTVTTVNGGVMTMIHALALQLAPIRINAIHPAIVGDSPFWADKPPGVLDAFRARTPLGKLVTVNDVVDASIFLLENPAVTGVNLRVDGGWMLT